MVPSANFKGIHNFDVGSGRSPSFFFFTDNKLLMIKTMKPEEVKILFDKNDGILLDYMRHISQHPGSLLSKLFGVF